MAEVTVYPEVRTATQPQQEEAPQRTEAEEEEEKQEIEERIVLSPSVPIILENALFCIDPLLLLRICSFLDMLSVMRFQCVSLRLSKFLKRNIKLQSLQQSNTDYYIDHALSSSASKLNDHTSSPLQHGAHEHKAQEEEEEEEEETIPIFSELQYRFPNAYQYDHYILLETDNNIFGSFQHIKQLYLRIIPPDSRNFVETPSSSYLSKFRRHQRKQRELEQKQKEKDKQQTNMNDIESEPTEHEQAVHTNDHDDDGNQQDEQQHDEDERDEKEMDFNLLHSADSREYAQRAPITKVETSIYSRSIFAYFDHYFTKIDSLILEFNPYLFNSTFLTFNIPKILSKVKRLCLIKSMPNLHGNDVITSSQDIYCHECVSLLQYTRNLRELTFNFPLSSDFYPVLNNLETLKIMHRIEQPFILNELNNDTQSDALNIASAYAQNIVTINNNLTTLISNVKLQKSLIKYFSPSIKSLHLHGSKGLQQLNVLTDNLQHTSSVGGDEELNVTVESKHKVFFGLEELCIHCSDSIYQFVAKYMNVVPQLKRLLLVFGKSCSVSQFIQILNHFHSNCVLNYTYNPSQDSWLSYYYNYYIYYGYNLSNSAKQLRYVYLITKKTSHYQNYQLLNGLKTFLKNTKITLLHIRLLIQYSYWCTADLMNVIELFSKHNVVFGRDNMSYQIIMPLKRQYQQPSSSTMKNKIKDIKDDFKYKQADKYASLNDDEHDEKKKPKVHYNDTYNGVIDKNSLKGIASYVTQKGVGRLQVIPSENGRRDEDMVVIEKLRCEFEPKQKYVAYKEFLYGQDEDYRNQNKSGDERKIYKEKIAQKLLTKERGTENEDESEEDKEKEKMFVQDMVKKVNDSQWINECYFCDLLK